MAETVESLVIKLRAQGINVTEKQLRKLDTQSKKTGMSMKGMIASVGGVYALARAFTSVVSVGKEFQKSQSNLAAIIGTTRDQLGRLDVTARELGATTKFTASQVVELQTEYAKLGYSAEQITAAQKATLDLAAATNVDLATAATVAGQTVNAFGLGAASTDRIVNVMAASFSSSALDMEKFSNSMTYVSAIAKQTGISIEATTGILGKLADVGIDGSVAGTQLRRIFLEMGNESSKLSQKLGYAVTSEEELFKALKELEEMGLSTAEMTDLVGKRAVAAFANMIDMADASEELTDKITDTEAAMKMADEQMDNLDGDMLKMTSATEGLAIEMYEELEPILRSLTQTFTTFISWLDVPTLKSYATAISIVTAGWWLYNYAQKAATFAVKNFKKALISTGIGALVVGLGMLIDLMGVFETETEAQINTFEGLHDSMQASINKQKAWSKDARIAALDWESIYENVDNAIMANIHLSEEAQLAKINDVKKILAADQEQIKIYDELSTGIGAYKAAMSTIVKVMDDSSGSSKTNIASLKAQDRIMQDFTFTNTNAATVLENMPDVFEKMDSSADSFYTNLSSHYKTVGYNLAYKEFDAGVKITIGNLEDAEGAIDNFTVKTIFNLDATAHAYDNYGGHQNQALTKMNRMLDTSGDSMDSYRRQLNGAFGGHRYDDIMNTANAYNEVERALNQAQAALSPERFRELIESLKVDGVIDERFLNTFEETHNDLEFKIAKNIELLEQYEDFFVKHLADKWLKVVESLELGVKALSDAEQQAANKSTLTIATNLAKEKGVENLSEKHLAYITLLVAETDALGRRIYTDEQVLELARNTNLVGEEGNEILEKSTLAQIRLAQAKKDSTTVNMEEQEEIIGTLIAIDQQSKAFDMTADNIDEYVKKVQEAIEKGASLEEALTVATGLEEGERTDEDIEAKHAKELELMQAFNDAAHEITLSENERAYETKLRQDRAELDAEFAKVMETAEFKALLVSKDEEDKKKLLKIQESYLKQKEKLDNAEKLAAITKHNNIADLTSQTAGALAGFWQATGKNAELVTNLQYVQAIADTYKAATSALANAGGWPLGIPAMAVTIVQGMAQVAQIAKAREQAKQAANQSISAEYGANFVTAGPTNLIVGDNPGGREKVNVTPLSSPNMRGGTSDAPPIQISVSGNVMSKEFVEDELIETLNEAIRQGNIITS